MPWEVHHAVKWSLAGIDVAERIKVNQTNK